MGAGIAQLFAARGFEVAVAEPVIAVRDTIRERINAICVTLGRVG